MRMIESAVSAITSGATALALEVESVHEVAHGVVAVTLADPQGHDLPRWEPGAHVELVLGNGHTRQYSLCGSLDRPERWTVAVRRDPQSRGGSEYVHSHLLPGDQVHARGPVNSFALVDAQAYRFIAGGIGITPLVPMIERLAQEDAAWQLLYCGRTRGSMAFAENLTVYGPRVVIWPSDEHGTADLLVHLGDPAPDTAVYCCGPERLIAVVEQRCAAWPPGALHVERFRAPSASDQAIRADAPFTVALARSGTTIEVGAGESILDALEARGIDAPSSCREGTCGTCETRVLEGIPDHRDYVLTPEERNSGELILPCCSRALGPTLVLDL